MKQAVTARTVNYEMQLLRGTMSYAACWTPGLIAYYKPLRQSKSTAGKAAGNDQIIKLISTAKKNDYWELAMYCAAVVAGTGCRSCEIRSLQLEDIQLKDGKIRVRR